MRLTTFGSILAIGLAGAAIAQVSQPSGPLRNATAPMNTVANDMAPMTGSNGMSNGSETPDSADPLPGNTVGAPTEDK